MAKVVAPEGFSLALDSERMTFGHSTEVEVPLLPELGVGERQFTIVRFGQKHFIEHADNPSAPTKVNGDAITKHALEDGDEICAGDLVLVFRHEEDDFVPSGQDNQQPEAQLSSELEKFIAPEEPAAQAPSVPVEQAAQVPLPDLPSPADTAIENQAAIAVAAPTPAPGVDLNSEQSPKEISEVPAAATEIPSEPAVVPVSVTVPVGQVEPVPETEKTILSDEHASFQSMVLEPSQTEPASQPVVAPSLLPDAIPVVTPLEVHDNLDLQSPTKPGRETQRLNLASAISSALTPRSRDTAPTAGISAPSTVEQLEESAKAETVAAPPSPAPNTGIPGPPSTGIPAPPPAAPAAQDPAPPSASAITPPASPSPAQNPAADAAPVPTPPATPADSQIPVAVPSPEAAAQPLPLAPVEAATPEAPQAASAKKSTKPLKPRKPKRARRPLFPFLRVAIPGLVTLGALAAGGYYAWDNYFKPEEKAREYLIENDGGTEFPSTEISAQDILPYLPADAERTAYIDVRTAYCVWSATMNPSGDPIDNPIDDFVFESTGVGLVGLDYIGIGGDANLDEFVAVVGFSTELNPAELYSGIERNGSRVVRVETIDGTPMRVLERGGREMELVLIDPYTVLISSQGKMRPTLKASRSKKLSYGSATAALGKILSDDVSFAMAGIPGAMGIGPALESFGCPASPALLAQIESMDTVTISCTATNDLEATLGFIAKDAVQAAKMTPTGTAWLATAPQSVRDAFRSEFPDEPLPGAFDRFLESAEWATSREVNRIRLSVPRRDITKIIGAFKPSGKGDHRGSDQTRQTARDFVSIFASGIAGGNIDLPKAGSVGKAIELLMDGVRGGESFSTTEFRYPYDLSGAEIKAVARYLIWEDSTLVYRK